MNWSDTATKIKQLVIPLHDKEWLFSEIHKKYVSEGGYDMTNPEHQKEVYEDLAWGRWGIDGSIVIGCPCSAEDEEHIAFGLRAEGHLDDGCYLEYILNHYWEDLTELAGVDLHIMESTIAISVPDVYTEKNIRKDIHNAVSELIALSVGNPNNTTIVKSTADCKKFLDSTYGEQKYKRTAKRKWGVLEFRAFTDEDENSYTIVTHNDIVISHYEYAFDMDY